MIYNKITYYLLGFLCLCMYSSCKDNDNQTGDSWISGIPNQWNVGKEGGHKEFSFILTSDVPADRIDCTVPKEADNWCEATISGNKLYVMVFRSYVECERSTNITISSPGNKNFLIEINQEAGSKSDDIKIKVLAGKADTEATVNDSKGNPLTIQMSYDGDYNTYFQSIEGVDVTKTFRIVYTLEEGHTLNRILLTPRADNSLGVFSKFEIEVSTTGMPASFIKVASIEREEGDQSPLNLILDTPIKEAKFVRFLIQPGYQNRISCAEMEFFEESKNKFDYTSIFSDALCSRLKPRISSHEIKNMPEGPVRETAEQLLKGTYKSNYRLATYRPYQDPTIMATQNRTKKYSLRDNPTGIYATPGEKLFVALDDVYEGADISILVQDLNGGYANSKTYHLKKGLNEITTSIGGLIYVLNHVEDNIPLLSSNDTQRKIAEKSVKVHFIGGKVNGYYDSQKNTIADWTNIINNAPYQDIDVLGKYAHITWKVADFRSYNTNIESVLKKYDRLVYLEQEFLGLVKYNKMYNNRMHFAIDYKTNSPNASNFRTVYLPSYAEVFCDPDRFEARLWGPSHEVGHCNQINPGFKWIGMTEVSNNLLALYVQEAFGQPSKLLVDKGNPMIEDGSRFYSDNEYLKIENWYQVATDYIVKGKRSYFLPSIDPSKGYETKLVPLWQLKLYLMDVLGKKEFYHDLCEYYRTYEVPDIDKLTNGILQLDFVRQVCRISGINLIDFFKQWGFLTPIDAVIKDYSSKKVTITKDQISDLIIEINNANYQDAHQNVHEITEANMNNYK